MPSDLSLTSCVTWQKLRDTGDPCESVFIAIWYVRNTWRTDCLLRCYSCIEQQHANMHGQSDCLLKVCSGNSHFSLCAGITPWIRFSCLFYTLNCDISQHLKCSSQRCSFVHDVKMVFLVSWSTFVEKVGLMIKQFTHSATCLWLHNVMCFYFSYCLH